MSEVFERRMAAAVARILKGISFQPNQPDTALKSQFRVQDGPGPNWRSRWMSWWRSPDSEQAMDTAGALIKSFHKLNGVSRRDCSEHVREVLYDLRHLNVVQWPEDGDAAPSGLWDRLKVDQRFLLANFITEAVRRCTASVAPSTLLIPIMPRLRGIVLRIPEAQANLIPKGELANEAASQLCVGSGSEGQISESHLGQIEAIFKDCAHHYFGTSDQTGTQEWCIEHGSSRIRSLLGTVATVAHHEGFDLGLKVISPPPREIGLLRREASGDILSCTARDSIFPYLGYEIQIDDVFACKVQHWYSRMRAHPNDMFERACKCAFFVNLGLCNRETSSFIYFFIALDALFGRKHSVGKSIIQGVERCAPLLAPRVARLYDLRNKLIHGGTVSVSQWQDRDDFEDEFGCAPDAAVREITLKCLFTFPD